MNIDFNQKALDFVRENNCAMHTPVGLIQKAMEQAASGSVLQLTEKITLLRKEMKADRLRNIYKG